MSFIVFLIVSFSAFAQPEQSPVVKDSSGGTTAVTPAESEGPTEPATDPNAVTPGQYFPQLNKTRLMMSAGDFIERIDEFFLRWIANPENSNQVERSRELSWYRMDACRRARKECYSELNWISAVLTMKLEKSLPVLAIWWDHFAYNFPTEAAANSAVRVLVATNSPFNAQRAMAYEYILKSGKWPTVGTVSSGLSEQLLAAVTSKDAKAAQIADQLIADLFSVEEVRMPFRDHLAEKIVARKTPLSVLALRNALFYLSANSVRNDLAVALLSRPEFSSLNPNDIFGRMMMIVVHCHLARFELRFDLCESGIKKYLPGSTDPYLSLERAGTLMYQGKLKDAELLVSSIKDGKGSIFAGNVEYWRTWYLARLANLQGNHEKAGRLLNAVLQKKDGSAAASGLVFYSQLEESRLLRRMGRVQESSDRLDDINRKILPPPLTEVGFKRSLVLMEMINSFITLKQMGKAKLAHAELLRAVKHSRSPKSIFILATFLERHQLAPTNFQELEKELGAFHPDVLELKAVFGPRRTGG